MAGQNNATTAALDRWTPTNTDTNVPIAKPRARVSSSRWVYDGSYIRLKNISLGYNVPQTIINRAGFSSLRLTVSAQNLITFTKYDGLDPEVNYRSTGATDSNRNLGLDYGSYPTNKSITFGLKLGF
jgi:TonB-dependent starch-binding outer membrane protein SusC